MPSTTDASGSSAIETGRPVSSGRSTVGSVGSDQGASGGASRCANADGQPGALADSVAVGAATKKRRNSSEAELPGWPGYRMRAGRSGWDPIDTRTVDTHMRRLREKLGPAARYLETVRGVGYRFEGEG